MPPLMNRLAELLGPDLAQRLAAEFGGQTIYFPARPAAGQRDAEILAEFDGSNHEALARKYHISLQWVYHILRTVPVKLRKAREKQRRSRVKGKG